MFWFLSASKRTKIGKGPLRIQERNGSWNIIVTRNEKNESCFRYTGFFGFTWHCLGINQWHLIDLHYYQVNRPDMASENSHSKSLSDCWFSLCQSLIVPSDCDSIHLNRRLLTALISNTMFIWAHDWNSPQSSWVALDHENFYLHILFLFQYLWTAVAALKHPYLDFIIDCHKTTCSIGPDKNQSTCGSFKSTERRPIVSQPAPSFS